MHYIPERKKKLINYEEWMEKKKDKNGSNETKKKLVMCLIQKEKEGNVGLVKDS